MIIVTVERASGACVVRLGGCFEPADDPSRLAADLIRDAGGDPLLVDLEGMDPVVCRQTEALMDVLARSPRCATTVLVHPDLETRRVLRAGSHGLSVVPSHDLALDGRFASALVANGSEQKETS